MELLYQSENSDLESRKSLDYKITGDEVFKEIKRKKIEDSIFQEIKSSPFDIVE